MRGKLPSLLKADIRFKAAGNHVVRPIMLQRLFRFITERLRIWRNIPLILSSGLFDDAWYLAQNPDVAAAGIDPLVHYLRWGAAEGRNPHPLFDSAWYLAQNSDVAAAGINPLVHYLRSGAAEGRSPYPLRYAKPYLTAHAGRPDASAILSDDLLLEYSARDFVKGNGGIRTGRVVPRTSRFLAFVALQISKPTRLARKVTFFQRRTWLSAMVRRLPSRRSKLTLSTPSDLEIEVVDGVFRRTFVVGSRLGGRPVPKSALDPKAMSQVAIPLIAVGVLIRSIAIRAEGRFIAGTSIFMRLASSPNGPSIIDGIATYEPRTSQILWVVGGGAFEQGQRYFLHIDVDRPSGLMLPAALFDGSALAAWHLDRVEMDATMALPCQWAQSSSQNPAIAFILSPSNLRARSAAEQARELFAGSDIKVIYADRRDVAALDILGRSPVVVIDRNLCGANAFGMATLDLLRLLSIHGTSLILLESTPAKLANLTGEIEVDISLKAAWRHFSGALGLTEQPHFRASCQLDAEADVDLKIPHGRNQPRLEWITSPMVKPPRPFDGRLPHVAIVTILYGKCETLEAFLDAIYRQSYSGPITVVLVEDPSPESLFAEIEARIQRALKRKPPHIAIKVIRNAINLGNCASRNVGIEASDADICAVIDADCLINGHFVRAHVSEHLLVDTDAVLGPYNIESNGDDGSRMLRRLENDPASVTSRAKLQDPLLDNAFVNTVTRNLSIRRRWYDAHGGFDPVLSYSADPESGYGWEDVELGARVYAQGGTIRYTPHAFSVHVSHASSLSPRRQVIASAKNFMRLLRKHNFIRTTTRRWYVSTADQIVRRAYGAGVTSPDVEVLNADLESGIKRNVESLLPYLRGEKRRYKVLTHRWHVPHQYEIYKLPHDFVLVTGTGTSLTNQWDNHQRPLRPNVQLRSVNEIDFSEFDMAIVHFDENVLCPELSNSVLGNDWGRTFAWFLDNVKLPMVAVCHGTPPFVGQYGADPNPIENFTIYEAQVEALRRRLGDIRVVVNSHQCASEWRFNKTKVIWHGYDPQEFPFGRHDLDVVSHGPDRHRPHYRGAHQLKAVLERLDPQLTVSTHKHLSDVPVPGEDPRYSEFAFRNWLIHLGQHKVYLNTTLRSPMPRSRTEAMMCGVVPVSIDNHDVSRFIRNDVNGFSSTSVAEIADYANYLCRNPTAQQRVSAAARQTAIDIFNHDRFLNNWASLIDDTVAS